MVKFDEIIGASVEWTKAVLFRPFSPKKWLVLTFIALLAGSITGGNSNLNFRDNDRHHREASAAQQYTKDSPQLAKILAPEQKSVSKGELEGLIKKSTAGSFVFIIILAVIAGVGVFVVLLWLCSRFYFIFLEDVIRNDASIAAPFRNNKTIGNSFFKFNILFSAIALGIIALIFFLGFLSLSKAGAFDKNVSPDFLKVLIALLPAILLLFLMVIALALFATIVNDFVTIVMLKDKMKFIPAVKKAVSILLSNKASLALYILIKMGLSIVSSIIYAIASFVAAMSMIFPAAVVAGFFYFIYRVIPKNTQSVFIIAVILAAIPVLLFIWYCLVCMYLPFAVFFRTFSAKFFARLDGRYNLFKYTNE